MSPASGRDLEQDTALPVLDEEEDQQAPASAKPAVAPASAKPVVHSTNEPQCRGDGTWLFEASSHAQTSGGILNLYQTGVVDPASMGWDEEHDLDSINAFRVRQTLSHTPNYRSVNRNEHTLFDCTHSSSLSFVVRLYDTKGALDDCRIWGHSPRQVFAGQHSRHTTTSRSTEINAQNCHPPADTLVHLPGPLAQPKASQEQPDEIWDTSDTGS